MSPNLPSRTCLSALPLLFLLLLLPGCGGGGSSGSGAGADSGSVPAIPPAPPPPSDNAFSRHREFCAPAPDGTCHHWAPGAVKAEVAYERLATRHPGELPGQGVKVTVIDTGVQLRHWELSQPRTTSEIFTGDGDHHGDEFSHGTAVASLIGAQRDSGSGGFPEADFHGIAYGATMHVAGIRLGAADPDATYRPITPSSLRVEDPGSAALLTQGLRSQGGPDVINMSFQYPGLVEKYTAAELRASSPAALRAVAQAATPERDRALLVYAAGNSNGLPCRGSVDRVGDSCVGETSSERGRLEASSPAVSAGAMALIPELRPHSVAVVAIGRDGRIGDFSNRCGIAARWCIAAPGEDMLVAYWGPGGPDEDQPGYAGYAPGAQGTSFAAPIVSGGLAVVMHYFRGQLGNTEVLARVLGTADVTPDRVAAGGRCPAHLDTDGDRSACELSSTHGRGSMNLDRATRPVGTLGTGTPGNVAPLALTTLRTPAAWGDLSRRLGDAEVAGFDEWNAPFWVPLRSRVRPAAAGFSDVLPVFAAKEGEAELPVWQGLAWTSSGALSLARLRFAYTADEAGSLRAGGFSYASRGGRLHTGLVFEQGALLGGTGRGAFAGDAVHGLVFGTFRKAWPLGSGPGLRLRVSATLAGGRLGGDQGMMRAARGLYSAGLLALERGAEGVLTRVSLGQPLRAEGGNVRFRRPVARTRDGDWVYRTDEFGLRPETRALRLSLHHERPLGSGRIAFGASHMVDAGHVPGEEETTLGARYRLRF